MKLLIIRLTIALITFVIGIVLPSISFYHGSQISPQPAPVEVTTQIPFKPQPKESPSLPPELNPPKGTDLSIMVALSDDPPSFTVKHIKLDKDRRATIDLDLGEHIYGQEVTLHFPDSSASYRILERYRNSMTISAEGPHLDLVDWRHFDSSWTPLKSQGASRFRTLESEQIDSAAFPKTTGAEIIKEVRRRVGKDWPRIIELAETCNGPDDNTCIVTISSIYLRIQKQVGDRWSDVGMVEIRIPMGC